MKLNMKLNSDKSIPLNSTIYIYIWLSSFLMFCCTYQDTKLADSVCSNNLYKSCFSKFRFSDNLVHKVISFENSLQDYNLKNCVLILGPTGSGKSTLVNHLLGSKLYKIKRSLLKKNNPSAKHLIEMDYESDDDDEFVLDIYNPAELSMVDSTKVSSTDKNEEQKETKNTLLSGSIEVEMEKEAYPSHIMKENKYAPIGHGSVSQTLLPEIYTHDNINYCDLPGFFDNRGEEISLLQNITINILLESIINIKAIIFVVDFYSLQSSRGEIFYEGVVNIIRNIIKNDRYENVLNNTLLVFTKTKKKQKKILKILEGYKQLISNVGIFNNILKFCNIFTLNPDDIQNNGHKIYPSLKDKIKQCGFIDKKCLKYIGDSDALQKINDLFYVEAENIITKCHYAFVSGPLKVRSYYTLNDTKKVTTEKCKIKEGLSQIKKLQAKITFLEKIRKIFNIINDKFEKYFLLNIAIEGLYNKNYKNLKSLICRLNDFGEFINSYHSIKGYNMLHYAIANNSITAVRILLNTQNKNERTLNKEGYTPLHLVIHKCKQYSNNKYNRLEVKILKYLITQHVDVNKTNNKGITPLEDTIFDNLNIEIVELLLQNGANPNIKTKSSHDGLLHYTCNHNKILYTKALLNNGTNVNYKNKHMNTPLHIAVKNGNLKIVKLLAAVSSIQIDRKDKQGYVALELALLNLYANKGFNIMQVLLKNGANSNRRLIKNSEMTLLHYASYYNNLDHAKTFLETGAKINYIIPESEFGYTALHWAAQSGNIKIIKLLKDYNADFNIKDFKNCTPLERAFNEEHLDAVKVLIKCGANPNTTKSENSTDTLLKNAVKYNKIKLAEVLLENGADPNIVISTDEWGSTALHLAAQIGSIAIIKLLHKYDTCMNKLDKKGYTPLKRAIMAEKYEAVKLLKSLV